MWVIPVTEFITLIYCTALYCTALPLHFQYDFPAPYVTALKAEARSGTSGYVEKIKKFRGSTITGSDSGFIVEGTTCWCWGGISSGRSPAESKGGIDRGISDGHRGIIGNTSV